MTAPPPFEITTYNRDLERTGWVGAPIWLSATPRHNQQPTASITLAGDDEKIALLAAPGARAVLRYQGEHLVGGPARLRSKQGSGADGTLTFQITDDWWLLSRVRLWQVPGAAITAQSTSEYHTVTGPAETVAKTLLGAAITRIGLPITVAPDEGRGDTITVQARMSKPTDVLYPLVDQAGIGITVRQVEGELVLDCYEPTTWPITLSEPGGTITDSSWSLQPPEPTRVVLAADGEGTARTYREQVNAAAEAEWDVVEDVIDARDLKATDPDFEAAATARMTAALAAGAMKAGLSISLSETEVFRYGGKGVHVGDRLPYALAGGLIGTDVLRTATLSWGADGVDISPVIGERRDDPDEILARAIAANAKAIRDQQARS